MIRLVVLRRELGAQRRAVIAARAELAVSAAAIGGWALLTLGVRLVAPQFLSRAVWPISAGLLLLSICGWSFLGQIAAKGLYTLTRPEATKR